MLTRDEALAELTSRYFTSHGPARVQDFTWWSGLTQADAKAGLEMAKPHIMQEIINGQTYYRAASGQANQSHAPTALLLPPYDEYTIAYKNHSAIVAPEHAQQARNSIYGGVTVIDGLVVGNWKRTFSKGAVVIESAPFRPLSAAESDAFVAAARRYGEYLEMPVVLV
jgi:hypothetical protein